MLDLSVINTYGRLQNGRQILVNPLKVILGTLR